MTLSFERYSGLLLPLDMQAERLRRYDELYWDKFLTGGRFAAVETASEHVQSVEALEILPVSFGSSELDVEMWWRVLEGECPRAHRSSFFRTDAGHLRRLESNVRRYEPGVHRVKINLAAHWKTGEANTVDDVRAAAGSRSEALAHSEVLAAYGLHIDLTMELDGTNLPHPTMPGFEAFVPTSGGLWQGCPVLMWYRADGNLSLTLESSKESTSMRSAPVILAA